MATAPPIPTTVPPLPAGAFPSQPGALPPQQGNAAGQPVAGGAAVQALVPASAGQAEQEDSIFPAPLSLLPVELGVRIPVRDFRVRQLLALEPGAVIESQWTHGEDLPLAAGEVEVAWSEFEVVEARLAVRITRLA